MNGSKSQICKLYFYVVNMDLLVLHVSLHGSGVSTVSMLFAVRPTGPVADSLEREVCCHANH